MTNLLLLLDFLIKLEFPTRAEHFFRLNWIDQTEISGFWVKVGHGLHFKNLEYFWFGLGSYI